MADSEQSSEPSAPPPAATLGEQLRAVLLEISRWEAVGDLLEPEVDHACAKGFAVRCALGFRFVYLAARRQRHRNEPREGDG